MDSGLFKFYLRCWWGSKIKASSIYVKMTFLVDLADSYNLVFYQILLDFSLEKNLIDLYYVLASIIIWRVFFVNSRFLGTYNSSLKYFSRRNIKKLTFLKCCTRMFLLKTKKFRKIISKIFSIFASLRFFNMV